MSEELMEKLAEVIRKKAEELPIIVLHNPKAVKKLMESIIEERGRWKYT